jgi:hypothetical protein
VLGGGTAAPSSGALRYEGVQSADDADPFYYRPEVDPPRHAGLLKQAQRDFRSQGLNAPWYPVVGNHDVLVQGNIAPNARTRSAAVGSRKLVALSTAALATAATHELSSGAVAQLLSRGLPGRAVQVTPDPHRRELSASELVARLRRASGHGGNGPRMDYTFDIGPHVRAIVVDLIRRDVNEPGAVRPTQVSWLRGALHAAGSRWIVVFTHKPLANAVAGERVLAVLDRDPHVVAAIAGDTHRNSIVPRRSYWLITTSSLVDYPQQARMFRLRETTRGVVLETWMVDPDSNDPLASVSRELAYLDFQGGRAQGFAGTRRDRNAALYR